ncbi:ABC transporter permease [Paenibacillus soyae]|uniref:ABC transporter permease n=1 Tax=Paenibacillus soyae TaxID=2969249 RepID=A0A9X2MSH5_9BACL|nr:ABC transporter permease [Paenibacillus soyae]MCR2804946.1 ABC transporter permease [Paenibacillus soyae]
MDNNANRWSRIWPPVVVLAALLGIWQAAVAFSLVEEWIVPSPAGVVQEAMKPNVWPRLMEHAGATIRLAVIGFAGGSAAGFVLAALLHLLPGVRRGVYPLLILSQSVPIVILAPLMTMLFGYGLLPKLLLVVLVCFFPVCVAMLGGLAGTDEGLRRYMRMIGSGKWTLFWKLELPGAAQSMFSGLKIAASYSVLSASIAEMLAPKLGLGGYMVLSTKGFMPERSFAAAILIIIVSLALFGLVALAEKLVIRWRPAKEEVKRDA